MIQELSGEVDYFNAIINMSCIASLIEDIFTFIISFILEKKKKRSQVPTWEKMIYILSIFWAFFLLLSFFIPNILGLSLMNAEIFTIVGYFVLILIGLSIRYYSYLHSKFIQQKTKIKD
ncbi:hypothetical protein [Mycoplasmopsis cynos]|uniref:hypothetical protein n=1 Tax=Mycoplasmopsis cynos TaxID=171284 RepID=UPI0018D4D74C|nr:hypothetical protein [Mycoplasmopsis cynos]